MIFIRTIDPDRQDSATGSWQAANLTHVNWVLVPDQIRPLVLQSGDILAHWQLAIGILIYWRWNSLLFSQPGGRGSPKFEEELHSCKRVRAKGRRLEGTY